MIEFLAYVAAAMITLWGVMHAVPTRSVVRGFEPISVDNRRVITQEWLVEAFAMWFIAGVVVITTLVAGPSALITAWLDRISALMLVGLAVLTTLTGARTPVIWFKVCPVLQTGAAILLVLASWS
jgi:hypothetical protein